MTWLVSMYESMYEWKYVCMKVCKYESMYVWKYVCMSRFSSVSPEPSFELCMNIDIWYAVILRFHDFYLGGQTQVAYIKICCKPSSFICISRSIFWNSTKFCMIDAAILLFPTFTSEVKQMWHMYKYVLKHPFSSKHIKCRSGIISWL